MNKRLLGTRGEEKALNYLINEGYIIIEKNYTCKIGEIDIIAMDLDTTVFIEVKYRKDNKMGRPYEAVDYYKQLKIMKVAMMYVSSHQLFEKPMRFDVVEIVNDKITLFKNAFTLKNNLNYL